MIPRSIAQIIFTILLYLFFFVFSVARDTINIDTPLSDNGETLISVGKRFKLGFFSPDNSNSETRYVGIWYYSDSDVASIVWVANRLNPVSKTSASLAVDRNGNLVIMDNDGTSHWSTDVSGLNATVQLMDSGNLVLNSSMKILWQSFDNPTDTFLPGMVMHGGISLSSWKGPSDPRLGDFVFMQDQYSPSQFIIAKGATWYWKSDVSGNFTHLDEIPDFVLSLLLGKPRNCTLHTCSCIDQRIVMKFSGQIQYLCRPALPQSGNWSELWAKPSDNCSVFNFCGVFGSCNSKNGSRNCNCLLGFEPSYQEQWVSGEFSGGCARKSPLCDESTKYSFLNLKAATAGKPDFNKEFSEEEQCRDECYNTCGCQAYSFDEGVCWIWSDFLNNIQENVAGGRDLHIRLAVSDIGDFQQEQGKDSQKMKPLILIIGLASGSLLLLICIAFIMYYCRRGMVTETGENRENIRENQVMRLYDKENRVKDIIESSGFTEEDKEGIDVPYFDMESILAATNNFSEKNKLGQGGFGPVYKGLFKGQEIAVKRLLSGSSQGLEQFKNEVVLIAKLQHRNLVRLLGYCLEGKEMILLYEYMPNKSLDFFIFDEIKAVILDWEKRFDIILGIARGVLYLHQDSRLRIIHRDLKTSNVLLDDEMNPKISDFGLARIFESKQIEATTNTVVGTYGYMSPEYATEGFFSVKSDIFSFGVVVLEILGGKKNTGFYKSEQTLSLLGYAYELWAEGKALDLMDPTLSRTCNTGEFIKCLNIGLLCVQEDPNDRPTMSNIVATLVSENATLPAPKQPAFAVRRRPSTSASTYTYQDISNSLQEGR